MHMLYPLYRRLAAHKDAGTYQRASATKAFLPIVNAAASKYQREFGSTPFSSGDRRSTTAALADYFEIEWDLNRLGAEPAEAKKSDAQIKEEIDQWQREQGAAHAGARQARKTARSRSARPRAYGRRDV